MNSHAKPAIASFCWQAFVATLFISLAPLQAAYAQIAPSDDSYTLTSSPSANFGSQTTLAVQSSGASTFLRFDLSAIPSTVTGSMVAKATLRVYVGSVPTAGSFNVDLVTSSWKESTLTANNAPSLGSAIASAIPITSSDKNQYVVVDVTSAVVQWINGTANYGLALVPDGSVSFTLNSKESTTTSHPAELDIVLSGPAGPPGPITGVTAGPGLTGGGTKGTVKVSLLTTCTTGQVLKWNGTTWACSSAGSGTISAVNAGTGLTGGGSSGAVTLALDTTKVPLLAAANTFTAVQQIHNSLLVSTTNSSSTLNATNSGSGSGVVGSSASGAGIFGTSSTGDGVFGQASGTKGVGILGRWSTASVNFVGVSQAGVWGDSGSGFGVLGSSDNNAGVVAISNSGSGLSASSTSSFGVIAESINAAGVQGFYQDNSLLGSGFSGIGVWGDSGVPGAFGVVGTADDGNAVFAKNSSVNHEALYAENDSGFLPNKTPLAARFAGPGSSTYCYIARDSNDNGTGDLVCTGSKSAAVAVEGSRMVRLYAVEATENWFEDAGSGQLSNGSAKVALDGTFAQTVNGNLEYHVFITANGECEGLYVSGKNAAGFEVRELRGGHSNVAFDYRIMVRRRGFEKTRMQDVTQDFVEIKRQADLRAARQAERKTTPATTGMPRLTGNNVEHHSVPR